MASANTITVNEANFASEVEQSPVPVLVDFWAQWCGPCRQIAPMLDQIADETVGKAKVAKLNVDECPNLSVRFGVRSIPLLVFFKGGEAVESLVGAGTPKDVLKAKLLSLA